MRFARIKQPKPAKPLPIFGKGRGSKVSSKDGWTERDNFETEEQAKGYVRSLRSQYGRKQPYRIVHRGNRYVVEYIPAHHPANPYYKAPKG
jgi:hypothetical protein